LFTMDKAFKETGEAQSQDVGNIIIFEHVNLEITDQNAATVFYLLGLGLTRDPYQRIGPSPLWVNAGYQQFHLVTNEERPKGERVCGHIALLVPSIEEVLKSLAAAAKKYNNYHSLPFKFSLVDLEGRSAPSPFLPEVSRYIDVTCPWGNKFRVYEHNERINFRGHLGIPYVEVLCKKGTAAKIGAFYHKFLGAPPAALYNDKEDNAAVARVVVGVKQVLIFKESDELFPYSGYHFCIYISDFSSTYKKLEKYNLLFNQPKFEDKCHTLEQALSFSQFRVKSIVNPDDTSEVVLELEHEVRSLYHQSFMRPLVNRSGNIGIYCNQ